MLVVECHLKLKDVLIFGKSSFSILTECFLIKESLLSVRYHMYS